MSSAQQLWYASTWEICNKPRSRTPDTFLADTLALEGGEIVSEPVMRVKVPLVTSSFCVDEGLKSDGCSSGAMSPLQGMGYFRAALQFLFMLKRPVRES